MKNQILENLHHPEQLEKLYQKNKSSFKSAFFSILPKISETEAAIFWEARLTYSDGSELSWGSKQDLIFVIAAAFMAGLIAKIPDFTSVSENIFYSRNLPFVVFPVLTLYFIRKRNITSLQNWGLLLVYLFTLVFINLLPENTESHTLFLSCIHLPLFMWGILSFAFTEGQIRTPKKQLKYLRYNGDLVVMAALILISGGLLMGITLGLFSLININIEKFYTDYVVVWGLAAAPLVATYLVQSNPSLVNKVSTVIAKIFTPLVLLTLILYLIAVLTSGKDPFNDREFLLIFNLLLLGVMAIILFALAENSKTLGGKIYTLMLFALSVVTVLVNGVALAAIIYRISLYGISPNRLAVIGSNSLLMIHLILISKGLFSEWRTQQGKVEEIIARYLPVYMVWVMVVTFLFPLIFRFK